MTWAFNDGGRAAAGYKGHAGDCACRAVAIATGRPYQEVYDAINAAGVGERRGTKKRGISNARTGVYSQTLRKLLAAWGWRWTPTMRIGSGCTVHLRADELPLGRIIVALSKQYAAVVDGVVQDIYDPSRDGTRCVYGYWSAPPTETT